jgi:hypothetical protein
MLVIKFTVYGLLPRNDPGQGKGTVMETICLPDDPGRRRGPLWVFGIFLTGLS